MTRLLHLDLSLTSCVTLTKLFSLSPSLCLIFFSHDQVGWWGELSDFLLFEKVVGSFSGGCMELSLWVRYLGLGSQMASFWPLAAGLLLFWTTLPLWTCPERCSQSRHLCITYVWHVTQIVCPAWWVFINWMHPYAPCLGEETERDQPLGVPAVPPSSHSSLQGRCLAWL